MIRLADGKDIPKLMQIWQECFGDSKEYIEFFYLNRFDEIPTFVYVADDEVAAMVTLFPGQVVKPQSSYYVQYVYALATKKSFQRRGYATKLLDYVVSHPTAEGALTILVPACEKLFSFYMKLGFYTVGYKKTLTITNKELEQSTFKSMPVTFSELSPESYRQLRREAFLENGYLCWDEKALAYLLKEYRFCEGQTVCAQINGETGAILYSYEPSEQCLYIKETTLHRKQLMPVLAELVQQYSVNQVKLIISGIEDDYGYTDVECRPYVMIHSTSVARFPYANLMKD